MLDDVRVLKPDVLVLCCAAHMPASFDDMLTWDRVLRSGFPRARVWALLAADDKADGDLSSPDAAGFHINKSIHAHISSISPPETRPRGHYLCAHGPAFNIGFRSLAKDVVSIARLARDEQLATALAAEEAHNLAVQHAAGNLSADQSDAANLVIANNGIPHPAYATGGMHIHFGAMHAPSRVQTITGRPGDATRVPFGLRSLRARDSANGAGGGAFSLAGLVNCSRMLFNPECATLTATLTSCTMGVKLHMLVELLTQVDVRSCISFLELAAVTMTALRGPEVVYENDWRNQGESAE
eukprot:IDg15688t1